MSFNKTSIHECGQSDGSVAFPVDNNPFARRRFTITFVKPAITQLNFDDARHLQAAEGWLGLGDAVSAKDELEEITLREQTHPAVLQVRYAIYAKCEEWDMAADVAEKLASLVPELAGTWINLAYATRRKTGGGIPAAKKILLAAAPKFSSDCVIQFNLACYCSQLSEFEQAEQWLKKAAAIDVKAVRKMAADDPDLQPLWAIKGKTILDENSD